MTSNEIARLQTYLRRLFGSERIEVVVPPRKGMSVELMVSDEVVGTVHRDEDEGELSYSIHITVLSEDLPAEKPAATPAGRTGGTPRR